MTFRIPRRHRFVCALLAAGLHGSGFAAIKEFSAALWKDPAVLGALFTTEETRLIYVSGETNAVTLDDERVRALNAGLARLAAEGWRPDEFVPTDFKLGPRLFYDPNGEPPAPYSGGSYAEIANYVGFLPDSVVVPVGDGAAVPLWLSGLEAQMEVSADPNASLSYFEHTSARWEALCDSWANLPAAQRDYLAAMCERMRPLRQLALKMGLRATLDQRRLRWFLDSLEKEILEGRRDRFGPFLPLELRGVAQKAGDGFDVSVVNVERPFGVWIGKGESALGIRPLAVSADGRGGELDYLQTRWSLPVSGRSGLLEKPSADLVRKLRKGNFENLLVGDEAELSFAEIARRARRMDARLEQAQALAEAAAAPGGEHGQAVEDMNRFLEENAELRLVGDQVLEFHLRAEMARRQILAR